MTTERDEAVRVLERIADEMTPLATKKDVQVRLDRAARLSSEIREAIAALRDGEAKQPEAQAVAFVPAALLPLPEPATKLAFKDGEFWVGHVDHIPVVGLYLPDQVHEYALAVLKHNKAHPTTSAVGVEEPKRKMLIVGQGGPVSHAAVIRKHYSEQSNPPVEPSSEGVRGLAFLVENRLVVKQMSDTGCWIVLDETGYPFDGGEYETREQAIAALATKPAKE